MREAFIGQAHIGLPQRVRYSGKTYYCKRA